MTVDGRTRDTERHRMGEKKEKERQKTNIQTRKIETRDASDNPRQSRKK